MHENKISSRHCHWVGLRLCCSGPNAHTGRIANTVKATRHEKSDSLAIGHCGIAFISRITGGVTESEARRQENGYRGSATDSVTITR